MPASFVAIALGLGLGKSAAACPDAACLARDRVVLHVAPRLTARPRARLDLAMRERPVRSSGEVEMPWIWRALRDKFYTNMPNHQERGMSFTLTPIAVPTVYDKSIPGLGVQGEF